MAQGTPQCRCLCLPELGRGTVQGNAGRGPETQVGSEHLRLSGPRQEKDLEGRMLISRLRWKGGRAGMAGHRDLCRQTRATVFGSGHMGLASARDTLAWRVGSLSWTRRRVLFPVILTSAVSQVLETSLLWAAAHSEDATL